jgi:hypothetical protein
MGARDQTGVVISGARLGMFPYVLTCSLIVFAFRTCLGRENKSTNHHTPITGSASSPTTRRVLGEGMVSTKVCHILGSASPITIGILGEGRMSTVVRAKRPAQVAIRKRTPLIGFPK